MVCKHVFDGLCKSIILSSNIAFSRFQRLCEVKKATLVR